MIWQMKRMIRQWLGVADQADIDYLRKAVREMAIDTNHNAEHLQAEIEMLKNRYSIIEKLNKAHSGRN